MCFLSVWDASAARAGEQQAACGNKVTATESNLVNKLLAEYGDPQRIHCVPRTVLLARSPFVKFMRPKR